MLKTPYKKPAKNVVPFFKPQQHKAEAHPLKSPLHGSASDSSPSQTAMQKQFDSTLIITLLSVLLLDQSSKQWIQTHFQPGQSMAVLPDIFHLTFVKNTGIAFSMLQSVSLGGVLLIAGTLTLLMAVFALYVRKTSASLGAALALGLILGGSLGNLADRIRLGHVVDFLEVTAIHFPVFNVADSAIVVGAGFLFWVIQRPSH